MEPTEQPPSPFQCSLAGNKIDNMCDSTLWEPKEEPLDDFLMIPAQNETNTQSAAILKEEVKEEPLDLVDSFSFVNEISDEYSQNEDDCKKEEIDGNEELFNLPPPSSPLKDEPIVDEYIQDLVRLGQIPAWDAVLDQSARYGMSPTIPVETKVEEFKEEVDSAIEEPNHLVQMDEFKDYSVPPTPQCVLCETYPKTVGSYILHLKREHGSTLEKNNIYLKCFCGQNIQTFSIATGLRHSKGCDPHCFTLHRREELTRDKKASAKSTPQCFLCEKYPATVYAYAYHLTHDHQYSLLQNRIYLLCSCGFNVISHFRDPNHKCDIAKFTVVRGALPVDFPIRSNEISRGNDDNALDCPMCEFYSTSVGAWYRHLSTKHNTTPKQAGLILRCACGNESRSDRHSYICNIAKFTVIHAPPKPNPRRAECDVAKITVVSGALPVDFPIRSNEISKGNDDNTLDCPMCEFRSTSVGTWYRHLSMKHNTTPKQAGLILRCACGNESRSDRHSYICNIAKFNLIRARTMRSSRRVEIHQPTVVGENQCKKEEMDDDEFCGAVEQPGNFDVSPLSPVEPKTEVIEDQTMISVENFPIFDAVVDQSSLVEVRSEPIVQGYIAKEKSSTFSQAEGINCSKRVNLKQNFTDAIEESDDEYNINVSPQCALCEIYPNTAYSYVNHLKLQHKSTLTLNDIYLLCSCGFKFQSPHRGLHNYEVCDARKFTVHKFETILERRIQSAKCPPVQAVQCILCETHHKTTFGYANHIMDKHESTLTENGIYLRCWCGIEVRSCNRDLSHSKECDGRQFTSHKITEG